ncbi:LOW QUALITY PROTEIN: Mucin-3B, partial [Galemys pyrenaicus]
PNNPDNHRHGDPNHKAQHDLHHGYRDPNIHYHQNHIYCFIYYHVDLKYYHDSYNDHIRYYPPYYTYPIHTFYDTSAITTSSSTFIPSSTDTTVTLPTVSFTSVTSLSTTTTSSTSPPITSTTTPVSSVTSVTTPTYSFTSRTSPTPPDTSSSYTETTSTPFVTTFSTTPCPTSVSITIVPSSATTPCIYSEPTPVSVFTSTTQSSSPSSAITSTYPVHSDASTSVPAIGPTTTVTDAPSSISPGSIPSSTLVTSTQSHTNGTWTSTVSTPHVLSSTSTPLTTQPSSNVTTAVMTSSKVTSPASPTTSTPETSVSTTQSSTTFTSSRTTSTTTKTTTQSQPTTTPGTCENGGTWMQDRCLCPPEFSGDRCERKELKCKNGGSWDGLKCHCPSTYYGTLCEFVVEQMELDTVAAEVGMEVSVDQEFSSDLNDNTSKAYEDFSNTFKAQMQKIYQNVTEFKGVEILSLRKGSILVDYLVLLEMPFSTQLESEYENIKTVLKDKFLNSSQGENGCNNQTLCFKPDSIKVNDSLSTQSLTPQAICHRAAAEGFEEFYFPLVQEKRLRCVTNCTSGLDHTLNCNQGQCILERTGPTCRCFSTDTHWFSGPRCEVAVPWRTLVGSLAAVGALLLLLLVAAVSFYIVRSRRKGDQEGWAFDKDEKWFDVWDEDAVGTFTNLGFEDEGTVNQENVQVHLETVDTDVKVRGQTGRPGGGLHQEAVTSQPTPAMAPCSHSLSHALWQVHIQRPEVTSSWL